ncbi:hypothetical protein BKA70DRAFT_1239256 [Coprinopsis sp. MPI-PUGE-AT-0042]|nr:hypothetical protein BKA70DRAFT_1239256 [Coprinopsis sp. MPI-PUGE-AT-0042]
MPVTRLMSAPSPEIHGPSTLPPLVGGNTVAGPSCVPLLPPAPIGSGLHFSYPGLDSTDSPSEDPDDAFMNVYVRQFQTPSPGREPIKVAPRMGPLKCPSTMAADGVKGKRRRTRAESMESLLNRPLDAGEDALDSSLGTDAESDGSSFPHPPEIVNGLGYPEEAPKFSKTLLSDYGVRESLFPHLPLLTGFEDQLQEILDLPQVSSPDISVRDENEAPLLPAPVPLGPPPSFVTAFGRTMSPITIRVSSEEPQPIVSPTRLRRGKPFFTAKEFDPNFFRGIQTFSAKRPVSLLLHEVANPGPGITSKELQTILRRCSPGCNKLVNTKDDAFGISQAQIEQEDQGSSSCMPTGISDLSGTSICGSMRPFNIGKPCPSVMSLSTVTTSQATPHCRTCHRRMRGHPKGSCPFDQASDQGSISETLPTPAKLCPSTSSVREGDPTPVLCPTSVLQAHRMQDTNTAKAKDINHTSANRSTVSVNRLPKRQPQRPPPTIEQLTSFLLGLDHPVDPGRARIALALLEELEETAKGSDMLQDANVDQAIALASHNRQQLPSLRNNQGPILCFLWKGVVICHNTP